MQDKNIQLNNNILKNNICHLMLKHCRIKPLKKNTKISKASKNIAALTKNPKSLKIIIFTLFYTKIRKCTSGLHKSK